MFLMNRNSCVNNRIHVLSPAGFLVLNYSLDKDHEQNHRAVGYASVAVQFIVCFGLLSSGIISISYESCR